MSHERKVIAAQVVASALALLIVYLTLLTPDDDGPLFGVQTPSESAQPQERQHARGARKPDRRSAKDGHGRLPTGPVFEPPPPSAAAVAPETDAPEFDQYTDTLGQITARLAAG